MQTIVLSLAAAVTLRWRCLGTATKAAGGAADARPIVASVSKGSVPFGVRRTSKPRLVSSERNDSRITPRK